MVPGLKKHHEIKLKMVLESEMSLLSVKIIEYLGIVPFVSKSYCENTTNRPEEALPRKGLYLIILLGIIKTNRLPLTPPKQ